MGKAIVYVAVSAVTGFISIMWYAMGKGDAALLTSIASLLAAGIAAPVLLRKDFQFVGIPGPVEILFAAGALATAIFGGLKPDPAVRERWFWLAAIVHMIPSIRVSLVSLKAYQRPKPLKVAVGIALAALFGLNVFLGIRHSSWLGDTSFALVRQWFPEATSATKTVPKPPPDIAKPKPPPPAPTPPVSLSGAPIAVVAGRELTRAMVDYQQYIDVQVDDRISGQDAVAALLQAYTARAILEQKFKAFEPSMLKDEHEWLKNRTRDRKTVDKIRAQDTDEMFLDVYVGANGLYMRRLQTIFAKVKKEELARRSREVLKEVQGADGEERIGPMNVDGVKREECRYSFKKRDFVGKFEEQDEPVKGAPKDPVAEKLATLKVNYTLPEIIGGDMNARIVRRGPDDYNKRPIYETYMVIEDALFQAWFKKQCQGMVIEIPDPELRQKMIELAKDVNHIIKVK
jgi:hypothetical protein